MGRDTKKLSWAPSQLGLDKSRRRADRDRRAHPDSAWERSLLLIVYTTKTNSYQNIIRPVLHRGHDRRDCYATGYRPPGLSMCASSLALALIH